MGNFGYLWKAGARNVSRNKLMFFASVGSLTACFLLMGMAVMLGYMFRGVIRTVGSQHEMEAYLEETVTDAQSINAGILAIDNVQGTTFASREDNLQKMCEKLGETPETLLASPEDNPFLASFTVRIKDTAQYEQTLEAVSRLEGVAAVKGSPKTAGAIEGVRQAGAYAAGAVVVVLLAVSVLIVTNTIKMTVFARRKEINIMKYVGATNSFIRMPFLVEGLLIGVAASIAALALLLLCFTLLSGQGETWLAKLGIPLLSESFLLPWSFWRNLFGGYLVTGALIGFTGGGVFIRKYLKV